MEPHWTLSFVKNNDALYEPLNVEILDWDHDSIRVTCLANAISKDALKDLSDSSIKFNGMLSFGDGRDIVFMNMNYVTCKDGVAEIPKSDMVILTLDFRSVSFKFVEDINKQLAKYPDVLSMCDGMLFAHPCIDKKS